MPGPNSFDYSVIRYVPRVEREEFVNVGVIVYCRVLKFLDARIDQDCGRLKMLFPDVDDREAKSHLEIIPRICAGGDAGPIGLLPQHERWHWLVAPKSTMIQMSPVHSGLTADPEGTLERLFRSLVGKG